MLGYKCDRCCLFSPNPEDFKRITIGYIADGKSSNDVAIIYDFCKDCKEEFDIFFKREQWNQDT
jgi:Pyruvate/2-oxoacid:ferredoxin oxidoreductase delta subunit